LGSLGYPMGSATAWLGSTWREPKPSWTLCVGAALSAVPSGNEPLPDAWACNPLSEPVVVPANMQAFESTRVPFLIHPLVRFPSANSAEDP